MRNKRIIRTFLFASASLLLLGGCTEDIAEAPGRNDGKISISFSAPNVAEEVSSRAALTENTTVRVVAYVAGSMTYVCEQAYYLNAGKLKPCTVNADGSFNAVDNANELALIPGTYDFYAITPALPLNVDNKTVNVPNGVDYASSVTSNQTVTADQTLTLTQLARKCAKIKLEIKKSDDNTAMTALKLNPSGSGVTFSSLPATASGVTLNADIPAANGTVTLNVPASAFTLNGTTSTATTYLLPRLGTNRMKIDYDLTYMVSGVSESKTVSGTMGNTVLEKGKSYTFTLTMRKTGATLTVVDWIESNQEVVTGQELDYTDNAKPWFLIAANDSRNSVDGTTTMNWYIATGIPDVTYNPNGKYKACPVGWRVPRHKELMLMWIYKDEFSSYTRYNYWGNDESSSNKAWAWFTSMASGVTSESSKNTTESFAVRCVRDYLPTHASTYPLVAKDGKTIVSHDEAGGVKENLLLTSTQIEWLNTTNTSTTVYNERSEFNKVSPRFKVADADILTIKNWKDAYSVCKTEYSESGSPVGTWRLPTQRELMLIYVLNDKLSKPLAASITNSYWAGPENSSDKDNACYLTFSNGTSGILTLKAAELWVRCIRDVE